jgi:hypothetical protein
MNGIGEHSVKQDKPSSEGQILHVLTHMGNLDLKSMNDRSIK